MKRRRTTIFAAPALLLAAGTALMLCGRAAAQTNANPSAAAPLPVSLLRDPFWPVGWQPPYVAQVDDSKAVDSAMLRWEEARKLLQLTGLSKNADGKFMAIVKGIGVVEEGDVVAVNHGGLTYRWKIASITPQGLVIDKVAAQPTR